MLAQRVITALVLVGVLLAALLANSPWPFALLSLLFIAAAAWEWGRLNQGAGARAWLLAGVTAGACALLGAAWHWPAWSVLARWLPAAGLSALATCDARDWTRGAALGWVLAALPLLRHGAQVWSALPALVRQVLGVAVLVAAWAALAMAKQLGLNFLLSVMALVWAADIGAYFGGRRWGRRKLAPSISPGKSWEGAFSGAVCALLLALAWVGWDRVSVQSAPGLYSRILHQGGIAWLVLSVLGLSAMSVVGDLVESLIKRQAGAKDSSQLLPGHGGVLDRIDALLPVLPLAMVLLEAWHER